MTRERQFKTEADLCAAFMGWARREGWTPYPETAGWDILLVAPDGTQIGIQAKLRFNLHVVAQAIEDGWSAWQESGPDYRAILVPEPAVERITAALGLTGFHSRGWGPEFVPGIKRMDHHHGGWHYWNPTKRHELPEFVPDVPAGASAPVRLTDWKIAALRLAAVLDIRGYVTKADFKRYSLDPRRWVGPDGWLLPNGAPGHFKARDGADLFRTQHPEVYPKVRAAVAAELKASERAEASA